MGVMDEESINRICITAFSEDDIRKAKSLLFDSVPNSKRKIRRREGKTLRDMDDIINLLKSVDPEEIPMFVARDLHKLPPVTFDHVDVTRLLKDILLLQAEIRNIKEMYATVEQLVEFKNDLKDIKRFIIPTTDNIENAKTTNSSEGNFAFVRSKRGAQVFDSFCIDSGPVGLQPMLPVSPSNDETLQNTSNLHGCKDNNSSTHITKNNSSAVLQHVNMKAKVDAISNEENVTISSTYMKSLKRMRPHQRGSVPAAKSVSNCAISKYAPSTSEYGCLGSDRSVSQINEHLPALNKENKAVPMRKTMAEVVKDGDWKSEKINEEWIMVQRKRLRNRFMGKQGKAVLEPGVNFKAAEFKVPIYIYNVAKDVTESDIIQYVQSKTNICVNVEKMNMKLQKDYQSYKIYVPKLKIDTFLSDNLWPEGITYRRFINLNNKNRNSNNDMARKPTVESQDIGSINKN
ncbi:unnamed protein product [Euphydryas editha]|uniref:Mutant cadherin n=2 Tax=Euphydryas editha TaxID=104508 RepID=A0AAU9U798_EUPED|nr:unnamed protein product [Euphydryas editha]